jgi:hypothetical protein
LNLWVTVAGSRRRDAAVENSGYDFFTLKIQRANRAMLNAAAERGASAKSTVSR